MKEIKRIFQVKQGNKWVDEFTSTDATLVYEFLSHDLIAKKINACTYIRSIKRVNNYNGTQTVTVAYDNATRNVYIVPN